MTALTAEFELKRVGRTAFRAESFQLSPAFPTEFEVVGIFNLALWTFHIFFHLQQKAFWQKSLILFQKTLLVPNFCLKRACIPPTERGDCQTLSLLAPWGIGSG
jgi:hypothetical protein